MAPTGHPAVRAGITAGHSSAARGSARLQGLAGSVALLRIARNAALAWGATDGPFVESPAFGLFVEAYISSYKAWQAAPAQAA